MSYRDFSLETVIAQFELHEIEEVLFPTLEPLTASAWLKETLDLGIDYALISTSEKARSEFVVAPILMEMGRKYRDQIAIYSGKNLDADRERGLIGECDFILCQGKMTRSLQSPILALVEAKKSDIDLGLGQCIAQMLGAQAFNRSRNQAYDPIFGCVTTGETWQFLKLSERNIIIDVNRYYIKDIELILGCLQAILRPYLS